MEMVYEKKDGLDPTQYVDILRALHITTAIMTDTIFSLAKMEIMQQNDAVRSAYQIMSVMDEVSTKKQYSVLDQGETFKILVRR